VEEVAGVEEDVVVGEEVVDDNDDDDEVLCVVVELELGVELLDVSTGTEEEEAVVAALEDVVALEDVEVVLWLGSRMPLRTFAMPPLPAESVAAAVAPEAALFPKRPPSPPRTCLCWM